MRSLAAALIAAALLLPASASATTTQITASEAASIAARDSKGAKESREHGRLSHSSIAFSRRVSADT